MPESNPEKPRILAQRTVATSRLFQIEELELRFSNGEQRTFERLASRGPGAVLVVPMLDHQTVLLIREYAAGLERYELSLPKGLIDPGENAEQAANRELMEEVGYAARQLTPITTLSLAPGYLAHQTRIILAQDLYPQRREGDEPEPLQVVPWSLGKLPELLQRDDFSEARSVAALFLASQHPLLNHQPETHS